MPFIRNVDGETQSQQLKPLRVYKDEDSSREDRNTNFMSQPTSKSKTAKAKRQLSNISVPGGCKNFNFIAILSALIAVLFVVITLINSYIILKTWNSVKDNQLRLDSLLDIIRFNATHYCAEYAESVNSSLLELQVDLCPVCGTMETSSISSESSTVVSVAEVVTVKHANVTKTDPLSLLTELAQRGAKFTCDIVCKDPLIVKSFLKVNSESQTWEGIGDANISAKQEAAFKALKELYPPHILAEVSYQRKNQSSWNCTEIPVQALNNSTSKINKKC